MATGRHGGPPNIKGTLGTLLRTTMHQAGLVRAAVERQAKTQMQWLDTALLQNKYNAAMTALGEVVYELASSGDLDGLEDFPEISAKLRFVQEVAKEIEEAQRQTQQTPFGARQRSLSRRPAATAPPAAAAAEFRVWRPPVPEESRPDSLGTVASADCRTGTVAAVTPQSPRRRRSVAANSGDAGIAWAQDRYDPLDEDLLEYMHEDDVPAAANAEPK